jgi:hypothetical protein
MKLEPLPLHNCAKIKSLESSNMKETAAKERGQLLLAERRGLCGNFNRELWSRREH